jgi:arylsulfatase A-like enzyme
MFFSIDAYQFPGVECILGSVAIMIRAARNPAERGNVSIQHHPRTLAEVPAPPPGAGRRPRRRGLAALLGAMAAWAVALPALAQPPTRPACGPAASCEAPSRVLPAPPAPFGGTINLSAHDSVPAWPPAVQAPQDAPNILLIITDDVGFGAPSTFGGVVATPALDQVAAAGLRYTQFHTTALCSPTRAALLTGRNPHSVGFGAVAELSTGFPGYNAIIGADTATIAETLRQNGYATAWFGKNHNTPPWEINPAGPFTRWPTGLGFDHFYGFMGGETSQWEPGNLFRGTTRILPFEGVPGWNLTTAMAEEAIAHIRQLQEAAPGRPWFIHYAPGGAHAPHHAPPEWIARFRGRFDEGWEVLRERIFANQQRLGVLPPNATLPPWPDTLPRWASLPPDARRLYARQAEVFAAYLAYTDHEIGRVIAAVRDAGQLDNTLVIYISGDNGGSAEGQVHGTPNEFAFFNGVEVPVEHQLAVIDEWGSPSTYPNLAVGWTWAFNTPYRWTKQVASHFGGTRNGMAISWPRRIQADPTARQQFHHVADIAPTILEAVGIPEPLSVNGIAQRPMEGVSLAYTWAPANAAAPGRRRTQHFEMLGHRAIYHDGWFANTTPPTLPWAQSGHAPEDVVNGYAWELYDLAADPTQAHDLAARHPARLLALQQLFLVEAARHQVLPLDNTSLPRLITPRPGPNAGRSEFVYRGPGGGLLAAAAPSLLNRAYRIVAEIEVPATGASGMIATHGGRFVGWGFYLLDGRPVFTWNLLDIERVKWVAPAALPPGRHTVAFEFQPDDAGPPVGRGGRGVLSVNGKPVAERSMARSVPFAVQGDETFDVGLDTGSSVDEQDYRPPFAFPGGLSRVTVTLGPSTLAPIAPPR